MTGRNSLLALLLSASMAGLCAQEITLRMAANVPVNSPWDIGLQRMAAEFDSISGGKVKIEFLPSAHVSTESDIIQKMRLGIDGALLTTYGLAQLYPDSLAISMPGLIRDDREFDAVLASVDPLLKSGIEDRFVVLAVAKGGWVRYFSRTPVVYPSDLANLRISLAPNQEAEISLMQSMGARVVRGSTADFLLQLNSNGVDAACVSPIYIATLWSQLRGKIAYMSSFKVAPFIGAIVFNKSSWERIDPELRARLQAALDAMAKQIGRDSARLEDDAIASLDGIQSPPESPDAAAKWAEAIAERRDGVIARMFSASILDTMDVALAKVRLAEKAE